MEEILLLGSGDGAVLENVAPDVFDDEIDPARTREFLADDRHHLIVALDGDLVVGFVSAVHYVHPDKPRPEFWIHEVGVATSHQKRGIGRAMMEKILAVGHELGCKEAWVLTERGNTPAMNLYAKCDGIEESPEAMIFTFDLNKE